MDSSDDDNDDDSPVEKDFCEPVQLAKTVLKTLHELAVSSRYNWFELVELAAKEGIFNETNFEVGMEEFHSRIQALFPPSEASMLENSYLALKADECLNEYSKQRAVHSLNGEIVTDDGPGNYLMEVKSSKVDKIVQAKVAAIRRQDRGRKAKKILGRSILSKAMPKKVNTIIDQYPDIGKKIEALVEECCIGADQWRRTGVLTFDRNKRIAKKCTYLKDPETP